MKTNPASLTARATIGALFLIIGVALVVLALSATGLRSATPTAGTLNPTGPTVTWAGTAAGGGSLDESTCVEGVNCDTYILTLSGPSSRSTGQGENVCIAVYAFNASTLVLRTATGRCPLAPGLGH